MQKTFILLSFLFLSPAVSVPGPLIPASAPPADPGPNVSFQTTDTALQRLYDIAEKQCLGNIKYFGKYKVLIEGGGYNAVWLETQPMGGDMYAKRDVMVAENNQVIFIDHQRSDGRLPGMVSLVGDSIIGHYGWLQGVCFPEPALDVYYWINIDALYLRKLYRSLERFDGYLWKTRDSDGDGCLESWCVWDTGDDNSTYLDGAPNEWPHEFAPDQARVKSFHVPLQRTNDVSRLSVPMESMDVMSYSYSCRDVLAQISILLKNGQSAYWRKKAAEVRAKIKSYLWDPEKSACYDRDPQNKPINILLQNNIRCMYYNSFDQQMADLFIQKHLLNPGEFWTPTPLASIAVNDPAFRNTVTNDWSGQPEGLTYQRAIRALDNYGHFAEVTLIGQRLIPILEASGRFTQQYDPFTGKAGIGGNEYGPTLLSLLEYIARMYGVDYVKGKVYWSGLNDGVHVTSYDQVIHGRRYSLVLKNGVMSAFIDHKKIFTGTPGVRCITDTDGKLLKIEGIDSVAHDVKINRTGDAGEITAYIRPNGVYTFDAENKIHTSELVPFARGADVQITGARLTAETLRCEDKFNPRGVDEQHPGFSWELTTGLRGVLQSAYEIRVGTGRRSSTVDHLTWESQKIASDQSVQVPYGGSALASGTTYYWQVRVWDNKGNVSAWSEPAYFQTALFNRSDWKAQWIEPGYAEVDIDRPSPLFRKEFGVSKTIRSATAYITAHGLYDASINGQRIGDAYLTPGWTSYNKRLQYQQYDVTSLLKKGKNAVGVMLGSGWYRGPIAWGKDNRNRYGRTVGLLFQLEITYTDGRTETVVSDGSWKSSTGSIVSSGIYAGETIDDRLEKKGWTRPGYDDAAWPGVKTGTYGYDNLVATFNEPIRKHETFSPVKIFTTPSGEQVIDFGQNLVGWVDVRATGKAGDSISVYHAEVLDKEGNFYTANLRRARENDVYVLDGKGEERFEPHFTFQGFRYIKVEGYPGTLKPEDFTAVALYSDMEKTGTFSCSNPLINQLQHNIQWGQRGNFLDVPTDCPQRDERLGWTGDAEVFSRTASFNMNVDNFFAKWLKDVAADQHADGGVPHVIPDVLNPEDASSAGWADVTTIVPWNMYLAYGDTQILRRQYASMKGWVEYMHHHSINNLWNTGYDFGDWLYYIAGDDDQGYETVTNRYFIAQCFYAHSLQLLINAATVLGNAGDGAAYTDHAAAYADDAAAYTDLLKAVKKAFLDEYVTPDGRLTSASQTAYVLALNFDMLPEALRARDAERLVDNIHHYHDHLTTGFLGTPYLCHVLTRFGYTGIAYKLLLQDTYPSWLYPVRMGATTIWERWDGIRPNGTFEDAGMNSFNHYSYGAIGDWMYRVITGIDEAEPGYRKIVIKPRPGGNLTFASADLKTYYGTIGSHWSITGGQLTLEVSIPANTTAEVYVPAGGAGSVKENGLALSADKDLTVTGTEAGYVIVHVGSGNYRFTAENFIEKGKQ